MNGSRFTKVLIVVTAVFIVAAGYFALRTQRMISSSITADGVVVDFATEAPRSIYPMVKFTTAQGQTLTVRGTISSNPPELEIGEHVIMYYDQAHPDDATIGSFWSLWFGSVFFGVFAFITGLMFITSMWIERRRDDGVGDLATRMAAIRAERKGSFVHTLRSRSTSLSSATSDLMQQNNRVFQRVALVFIGIGCVMIGIAAWTAWNKLHFVQQHREYHAHIIGYSNTRYTYPLFEFTDEHGTTRQAYSDLGTRGGDPDTIGTACTIYYDEQARVAIPAKFFQLYFVSLICGAIGVVFAGFGVLFRFLLSRDAE